MNYKEELLADIQSRLDANSNIRPLIEKVKRTFCDDDYFSVVHNGSRELIKAMIETYDDIKEESIATGRMESYQVAIPFLANAIGCEATESKMKVVLSVIGEIYQEGLLANYLIFCDTFSWDIAQLLMSISDYDTEMRWTTYYPPEKKEKVGVGIGRLNYLKYGDV